MLLFFFFLYNGLISVHRGSCLSEVEIRSDLCPHHILLQFSVNIKLYLKKAEIFFVEGSTVQSACSDSFVSLFGRQPSFPSELHGTSLQSHQFYACSWVLQNHKRICQQWWRNTSSQVQQSSLWMWDFKRYAGMKNKNKNKQSGDAPDENFENYLPLRWAFVSYKGYGVKEGYQMNLGMSQRGHLWF